MAEKIPDKWEKERRAAKAVQVAFDLSMEMQSVLRKEAVDFCVTPSDRIREILGLQVVSRRVRPRLSISLTAGDFEWLARKYGLDPENKVVIKQQAAKELIEYVENQRSESQ